MFNSFLTVTQQGLTLLLMISAGFILSKKNIVQEQGIKQMTNILLYLVSPMVILRAFDMPFDPNLFVGLGVAVVCAIITHLLGITLGFLFIRKRLGESKPIYRFAVIYSNCGFMALPLIQATIGNEGLFYGVAYVFVFTIFVWTQGMHMICHKRISLWQIIINPGIIGTGIAIILFVFSIKLPDFIKNTVDILSGVNTPLAMIIIGASLAGVSWDKTFFKKEILISTMLRLLIIPGVLYFILSFFNPQETIYKACMISASAPIAAYLPLFSAKYEKDTELAGKLVAFSTVCSMITMPIWVMLIRV